MITRKRKHILPDSESEEPVAAVLDNEPTSSTSDHEETLVWKCSDCSKVLQGTGNNTTNQQRHKAVCAKSRKLDKSQKTISSFFSPKATTSSTLTPANRISTTSSASISSTQNSPPIISTNSTLPQVPQQMNLVTDSAMNIKKCQGFTPISSTIDSGIKFPWHLLKPEKYFMEGAASSAVIHTKQCYQNNYLVPEIETADISLSCHGGHTVSKSCMSLSNDPELLTIINRCNDTLVPSSHMKDCFLSVHQLRQRLKLKRDSIDKLKLNKLNLQRSRNQINKNLQIHQRIMIYIKENNIPNIKQLITGLLNRGRSMHYVYECIVEAVAGLYNPRYV